MPFLDPKSRFEPLDPNYNIPKMERPVHPPPQKEDLPTGEAAAKVLSEQNSTVLPAETKETSPLKERSIKQYEGEGTPNFDYDAPFVHVPVENRRSSEDTAKICNRCRKDYEAAMEAMEESIADAIVNNKPTKELVNEAAHRMLQFLEKYAEVLVEMDGLEPSQAEILVYRLLADTYLIGEEKTKEYSGNVGSNPLAIRHALEGGNLREQLFLLLSFKKSVLKHVVRNEEAVNKINEKLQESKSGWQLAYEPKYGDDGIYEALTETEELRRFSNTNISEWKEKNNPTIETGDQTRFPPSEREKRLATGDPVIGPEHKDIRYQWSAGAAALKPATVKEKPDNLYLKAADELHLPLVAGISGTTDGIMATINVLGLNSKEEMSLARMACLAFFVDTKSHSVYEVMTSSKSFGLKFHPSPDYYKQIDPIETGFLKDLEISQSKRGFKMPDYYLSEKHFDEVSNQIPESIINQIVGRCKGLMHRMFGINRQG